MLYGELLVLSLGKAECQCVQYYFQPLPQGLWMVDDEHGSPLPLSQGTASHF